MGWGLTNKSAPFVKWFRYANDDIEPTKSFRSDKATALTLGVTKYVLTGALK